MPHFDNIDFRCSPVWLNFYHETGLTPRFSSEDHHNNLAYWDDKLMQHRREAEQAKIADEHWFADHDRQQMIARTYQKYQKRIDALEHQIRSMRQEQIREDHTGVEEKFTGIKVDRDWDDDDL